LLNAPGGGPLTLIDRPRLAVRFGLPASMTSTVNVQLPAVVGAPVIAPPVLRLRPGGRLPPARTRQL
jgi:hypothetical protein